MRAVPGYHIEYWYRIWYRIWYRGGMGAGRKITVEVPPELLEKAQRATGTGVTETVRAGLKLVAASEAYQRLRQLRGKVRFSRTAEELKADR
jgi:hypothetical protein